MFQTKSFARFAAKEHIAPMRLCEAVERVESGLIDADLGSGIIKQRIARQGQGKSGGYRTLIAFRTERFAVFIFGFAKKDRENITQREFAGLMALAELFINSNALEFAELIRIGEILEVECGKETIH